MSGYDWNNNCLSFNQFENFNQHLHHISQFDNVDKLDNSPEQLDNGDLAWEGQSEFDFEVGSYGSQHAGPSSVPESFVLDSHSLFSYGSSSGGTFSSFGSPLASSFASSLTSVTLDSPEMNGLILPESPDLNALVMLDSPLLEPTFNSLAVPNDPLLGPLEPTTQSIPDFTPSAPRSIPTTTRVRKQSKPPIWAPGNGLPCTKCSPAKHFKRRTDLIRHIQSTHYPTSSREAYFCDYRRCNRSSSPFYRRDHWRDHYRDFHNEDLERRSRGKPPADDSWFKERNTDPTWWRCSHCLERVSVETNGFECPGCKGMCCPKRRAVRTL